MGYADCMTTESIEIGEIKTLEDAIVVIELLLLENKKLKEEIARLKKDSSTSFKPPSSDIVKSPSEQRRPGERKSGAQPGHKGFKRELFPSDEVEIKDLCLSCCPECGSEELEASSSDTMRVQQVAELPERPIIVTEYRQHGRYCPCCNVVKYRALPDGVIPNQLLGPRLLSLLGYMKGGMPVSLSDLQRFCADVFKLNLAEGTISNAIFRTSEALKKPYEEVAAHVPKTLVLNIDETSWNDSGRVS